METFGERLSKLREAVGLNAKNLAMLLNTDAESVEYLEQGYNEPDMNTLLRVAQIFDVSKAYVAMLTDDPEVKEPPYAKEVYVASHLRPGDGMVTKANVVGTVYVDRDTMHGKDYYALIAKDNSMSKARIMEGDIMIIRRQAHAANGDIVVAMVDTDAEIVRRYHRQGNIVMLTAENDAGRYESYKIDVNETKLMILGKVCEVRVQNI